MTSNSARVPLPRKVALDVDLGALLAAMPASMVNAHDEACDAAVASALDPA
jgi:hypothetical protein